MITNPHHGWLFSFFTFLISKETNFPRYGSPHYWSLTAIKKCWNCKRFGCAVAYLRGKPGDSAGPGQYDAHKARATQRHAAVGAVLVSGGEHEPCSSSGNDCWLLTVIDGYGLVWIVVGYWCLWVMIGYCWLLIIVGYCEFFNAGIGSLSRGTLPTSCRQLSQLTARAVGSGTYQPSWLRTIIHLD